MMQYFWDSLSYIEPAVKKAGRVCLFLDFDGTVSPIVPTPSEAVMPKETGLILKKLTNKGLNIIFVSGRELSDLKGKVKIPGAIYSGVHGLEWEINGQVFKRPVPAETIKILGEIKEKMITINQDFNGSELQDKRVSVALSYRGVDSLRKDELEKTLDKEFAKYSKTGQVCLLSDNFTYELRANIGWTKGELVKHLMDSFFNNSGCVIYIGDSETDEDAFEVLNENITIKVGLPGRSRAGYFLRNEQDVYKFLQWLYTVLV